MAQKNIIYLTISFLHLGNDLSRFIKIYFFFFPMISEKKCLLSFRFLLFIFFSTSGHSHYPQELFAHGCEVRVHSDLAGFTSQGWGHGKSSDGLAGFQRDDQMYPRRKGRDSLTPILLYFKRCWWKSWVRKGRHSGLKELFEQKSGNWAREMGH